MNYPHVLLGSLICLFIILLILTPFADAYDYFESFNRVSGWYGSPLICIIDPDPAWKYYSIHAVKLWEKQLHNMGIYDHDYRIAVFDTKQEKCDATISFGSPNEVWKNFSSEVGGANCFESNVINDKKNNTIRNGTRSCYAIVNPDWDKGRYLYATIVHETGHILGIGHRKAIEPQFSPYVHNTKDIMNTHLQPFSLITPESIEALQHFYNNEGWNGASRLNYTIPHDR